MNKSLLKQLIALLTLLMVLVSAACAENADDTQTTFGHLPERGLILPMTKEDVNELGIELSYMMVSLDDLDLLPLVDIIFVDMEHLNKELAAYVQEDLKDPEKVQEIQQLIYEYSHTPYTIVLVEKDYYEAKMAAGITMESLLYIDSAEMLGENDGYVYVGISNYEVVMERQKTAEQKALAEKVIARCKELVANLSFQPIVFAKGEIPEKPEVELVFSTQDLNGNVVTQELFMGKKLTVLNVWGTYCTPCIREMPDLAEWSQNMPEGVQLVGLVCDLSSYGDARTLGTAQDICAATGADVYTNLVANGDFLSLLQGVVGVPTTFFIDGTGAFVGTPVVGANVAACKAFVEEYLTK